MRPVPLFLFLAVSMLNGAGDRIVGPLTQQAIPASSMLQNLLVNMGPPPQDVTVTGTVVLTEGSSQETGSLRVLALGSNYSREELSFSGESRVVVFSQGAAISKQNGKLTNLNSAMAFTAQTSLFPVPMLSGMLNNPDVSVQYLGLESLGPAQAHHFVLLNTFQSSPDLQDFSKLTRRDLWVDASTGLPVQLSYALSTGAGPGDVGVPVKITYSNYGVSAGTTYAQSILVSLNGTPWLSVSVTNIALNSGLSTSAFQLN
jgi:hypothetical protein